MLELEESFFSIRVHIIGNRRSAQRDRLAEHSPNGSVQLAQLLPRDGRRPPAGSDASPKQRLVGINVADAAQQLLIQKRAFDRSLAPAKKRDELLLAHLQWFHTTGIEAAGMNAELAKHPWIDKPEFAPRSELRDQVSVLRDLRCRIANDQAPGHSEMDDPLRRLTTATSAFLRLCFSFQVEHDVLACTMYPHDPLALER